MANEQTDNEQYQTFWRRVIAIILDFAALSPLMWLDTIFWNSSTATLFLFFWVILYNFLRIYYAVYFVYSRGQTLGKMATGVKVLSNDGNPLRLQQAILREIVPIIFLPIIMIIAAANLIDNQLLNRGLGDHVTWLTAVALLWSLLEIATMLTNRRKRSIHDLIAGTVVIKQPTENRVASSKTIFWALVILYVINVQISDYLPEEKNLVAQDRFDKWN